MESEERNIVEIMSKMTLCLTPSKIKIPDSIEEKLITFIKNSLGFSCTSFSPKSCKFLLDTEMFCFKQYSFKKLPKEATAILYSSDIAKASVVFPEQIGPMII